MQFQKYNFSLAANLHNPTSQATDNVAGQRFHCILHFHMRAHLADRRINLFSYENSNRRQLEWIRWEIHFFPKVLLQQTKIETNLSARNFSAGAHHSRFRLISKRHPGKLTVTKIIRTAHMHCRRNPQIERNKSQRNAPSTTSEFHTVRCWRSHWHVNDNSSGTLRPRSPNTRRIRIHAHSNFI